jgi:prepilin-type N-terminal cleavage/methylation domain-containing protein
MFLQAPQSAGGLLGDGLHTREITSLRTFGQFKGRGFTFIELMIAVGALSMLFAVTAHRLHQRVLHSNPRRIRDVIGQWAKEPNDVGERQRMPFAVANGGAAGITSTFSPSGAVTPGLVFVNPKFYDDPPEERDAPAADSRLDGGVCEQRADLDDY